MKSRIKPRIAWEDRFQSPKLEDLLSGFAKHQAQLIEQARESLCSLGGVTESIAWLGIPWRWTLAYGIEGTQDRPWVYLVPQPGKPLLALPMSTEVVASLPMRKLPKFIRDVIALSPRVGGVHWAQWELTAKSQVDELVSLAKRKHENLLSPAS